MTTTSERTMTPDGQIANPLDKAANREPYLTTMLGSEVFVLTDRQRCGTFQSFAAPSQKSFSLAASLTWRSFAGSARTTDLRN